MDVEPGRVSLKIEGMSCEGCVRKVRAALEGVAGVEAAEVSLAAGRAVVKGAPELPVLLTAVEEAGYSASPA